MTTKTINVVEIKKRPINTKRGPGFAYDLMTDDGTKVGFAFTDPATKGIEPPCAVTGEMTTDKWGWKMDPKTASAGAAGAVSSKAESLESIATFPIKMNDQQMAIIRQNALTNAVATVADYVATLATEDWPKLDDWVDSVITVAYKYTNFSSGQLDAQRISKVAGKTLADNVTESVSEDEDESDEEAA